MVSTSAGFFAAGQAGWLAMEPTRGGGAGVAGWVAGDDRWDRAGIATLASSAPITVRRAFLCVATGLTFFMRTLESFVDSKVFTASAFVYREFGFRECRSLRLLSYPLAS